MRITLNRIAGGDVHAKLERARSFIDVARNTT
jgi:hypothetical protein